LSRGVAFHISDLDREERLVIEGEFRKPKSTIRVIVATTTLAMGVNTPAEAVVIVGLTHPFDEPYSVAEYKNIVGRAGRLGYAQRGASYLLALSSIEEEHVWKRYVSGRPEDIISRFLSSGTDPRSLIVRVLVAVRKSGGQGLTADEIIGFLEGSFGAYQKAQATQNWKWDRSILARALGNLEQHKLIARCGDEGYELSKLGWIAGHGGIEVESITRLVELLTPLDPDSINDPTLIAAAQITVELDNVNFPLNKKSTQKEPQTWTTELRRQGVPTDVIYAMRRWSSEEHIGTLRAKKTAACLLWITDKPLGYIEEILTQFGGKFDGAAGPIRSTASRTHDLLPIVARVAEILHPSIDLSQRIEHLFVRLELGVAASAVDIAMQAGDRLSRSDYQSLVRAELSSVKALAGSSDEKILACVGDQKGKLLELRKALENYREKKQREQVKPPILPPYED
jgi:helicase